MTKKEYTQLERDLQQAVYDASVGIYEKAERSGIIRGDGFQMAVKLGNEAVSKLRSRLVASDLTGQGSNT